MSRIINDLFDISELAHHGRGNFYLCYKNNRVFYNTT